MKSNRVRCRIVFSVGGKGGVGKSWCVALLAQWFRALGVVIALVDCDDETSTTSRFFSEARFLAIRSQTEIDLLVQLATSGEFSVILVDLPARAGDEFGHWFALMPWEELADVGVRFTAIGVISGAKDSLECFLRWREFLGNQVDYIIALNRRDILDIYLGSRSREAFLAAKIPEIEIPKLDEHLASALDRANWTLTTAVSSTEPHLLTQMMSRARLRRYRDQVYAQFETVKTNLIP